MRPEFSSWMSLEMDKGLPRLPEMISLGYNLKTNKTHSDVGGQPSPPDI